MSWTCVAVMAVEVVMCCGSDGGGGGGCGKTDDFRLVVTAVLIYVGGDRILIFVLVGSGVGWS